MKLVRRNKSDIERTRTYKMNEHFYFYRKKSNFPYL